MVTRLPHAEGMQAYAFRQAGGARAEGSSKSADALIRTIADTGCDACKAEFAGLEKRSKNAVVDKLAENLLKSHGEELRQAAIAHVGGSDYIGEEKVNVPLKSREDVYNTAVHELIHALTHPAFSAAFGHDRNILEGFTDYFADEVLSLSKPIAKPTVRTHTRMSSPPWAR